jgi:hypothetical protein
MTDQPIALLVTGSRSLARDPRKEAWARAIISATVAELSPWSTIVHGGASGPDAWAQEAAESHRYGAYLLTNTLLADGRIVITTLGGGTLHRAHDRWHDGNPGPLERNRHMVEVEMPALAARGYTPRVLALVDQASRTKGTDHTVRLALKAGYPVDRREYAP